MSFFANPERNQQYESITSELCKLMQQYERKKNPFDIDIKDIVDDLNEKKLSVTKREDDYYRFINNTLFNSEFIESAKDESVQGLSLIPLVNSAKGASTEGDSETQPNGHTLHQERCQNKQYVNEYMKILKDKHYLLSQTLLSLMKQEQAITKIDAELGNALSEYINKYLRSKYTSRIELYNWISVQNERIDMMNNQRKIPSEA